MAILKNPEACHRARENECKAIIGFGSAEGVFAGSYPATRGRK